MSERISIFWFRRDLRLDDNVGLYQALQSNLPVLPIFIFDTEILGTLPRKDPRVSFIHLQLQKLRNQLWDNHQSGIALYHGEPLSIFKKLTDGSQARGVLLGPDPAYGQTQNCGNANPDVGTIFCSRYINYVPISTILNTWGATLKVG